MNSRRERPSRFHPRRLMLILSLTAAVILCLSGLALAADRWTDIGDAEWIGTYHVTSGEAATVAEGYPDGTFRPDLAVTRGQFAKMAVDGLSLGTAQPVSPTFLDVPADDPFYDWIEGGVAAGVLSGFADHTYRPEDEVSRQQADSILGAYLAGLEARATGRIQGLTGEYESLAAWFAGEGPTSLIPFADQGDLAAVHAPGTAYLVFRGVVLGSTEGSRTYLNPLAGLTRAQAVALILRTKTTARGLAFPTITGLEPTKGPAAGGNQVVIRGTGFIGLSGAAAVRFGAANALSYVVDSPLQITAVAPAGTAGAPADVVVTTPMGASIVTPASRYVYLPPPAISAVAPAAGPVAGGNVVVITGTGFDELAGPAAVRFGSANAISYAVDGPTQIRAVAPAGTAGTTVSVNVTTLGGTSANTPKDDYSYGVPTITGLSPGAGPVVGGNQVVISGTGFTGLSGSAAVRFGSANAVYVVDSPTQITAVVPLGTGGTTVDVAVTSPAGTSLNTLKDDYSYGPPAIVSVIPAAGPVAGGNYVVISGTGFSGLTGGAAVRFGAVNARSYLVDSPTQITAVAPAGTAGATVNVIVTTPAGASVNSVSDDYSYGPPVVSGLDPVEGPPAGGNEVVITGKGFTGLTGTGAVKFGTVNATSYVVDGPTQITAVAPAGSPGAVVDVYVTTPAGKSTNTSSDNYTYLDAPVIAKLTPAAGAAAGLNYVVITGTGFTGTTSVRFGSFSATYTVDSSVQITARAPAGTSGTTVSVSVTTALGTSANTASDDYSYGPPTVIALSPTHGPVAGRNYVIIEGTGFTGLSGSSAVRFGLVNARSYTVNSPTQITAVAPAGVAGTVSISVTTPAGSSANTAADDYTYQ